MASALKFLIQRNSIEKCLNKDFAWSYLNYDNFATGASSNSNNNSSRSNSNYEQHYRQDTRQQHEISHAACKREANAMLLTDSDNASSTSLASKCFVRVVNGAASVSGAGSVAGSAAGCACATIADAATLELKRRFHNNSNNNSNHNNNKLLHMRSTSCSSSNIDQRSIFYLTLLVVIYCCVLIRASSATSAAVHERTPATTTDAAAAITTVADIFNAAAAGTHVASNNNNSTSTTTTQSAFLVNAVTDGDDDDAAVDGGADDDNDNLQLVVGRHYSDEANPLYLHRASRDAANVPDDDDDSSYHDDEFDEYEALIHNKSAKGKYIGAPCDNFKCEPALMHVSCDRETELCSCQKNYPVQLGLTKGCAKPKKLGEQCFYDKTCVYNDENSQCVQVKHNALCQCASGFHSVSYSKPTRRVFCTQDLKELKSDLPTLLGVSTGIAVLAGLICMVLHLFSKTKYPRHRNFGDANLPPPIMYSSETGIPLTVQSGRPSSRSSIRSSGSIGSFGNRRSSTTMQSSSGHATGGGGGGSAGSKGILVSTSRTGSRRPSLASVHSTSSSVRSYSMMRFEKETQQKEIRQEMKLRLARLHQQQHMSQNKPQIVIGDTLLHHHGALARISMSTPSPLTPNSLDELLPSVDETQEFPSKSEQPPTPAMAKRSTPTAAAYNGPCSSSTEAL